MTWKLILTQLQRLMGLSGKNQRLAKRRLPQPTRLQVEALESRWLPSLAVTGVMPLQATEGTATPYQMLAQCSCDSGSAADYRVTIAWGDGTSSAGTIANFNPGPGLGLFNVYGSHTYTQDGSFTEQVSVSGLGASASGTGPVTVADAPLSVRFQAFSATEGAAFTGPVATFTDPNPADPAGSYAATIVWGDGTSSAGTVTGAAGSFSVAGTHTYSVEGTVTPSVTVLDADTGLGEAGSTQGYIRLYRE